MLFLKLCLIKAVRSRWQLIETPAIKSWDQGASFMELFLPSMGMYVVWQIAYLFITGLFLGGNIWLYEVAWIPRWWRESNNTTVLGINMILNISEVYYSEMLDSDPEIVTSLRYLSQDKKNPLTKLVTKAVRRVGLLGPEEPLDPSKPMTKGIFVSVQVWKPHSVKNFKIKSTFNTFSLL